MHQSALRFGKLFFDVYCDQLTDVTVVDIGSQDVNGSLKQAVPPSIRYFGIDFVPGKGVDLVLEDPYQLPFEDESVDVIVSSSCFEHSEMFWLTFLEVSRVLKPGGLLYINVPSNGMFHRYPVDCWRFYPDSGKALCAWAHRNGQPMVLLESFIGKHFSPEERWNDFVAVFVKGEEFARRHPHRITDRVSQYYNAHRHGQPDIGNEQLYPEDQLGAFALEAQADERSRQIERLQSDAAESGSELSNLRWGLEDRARQLATLMRSGAQQDEHIAELMRAIAERDGEIVRLSHGLTSARAELSFVNGSLSWRATAPFRALGQSLQELNERIKRAQYKLKREFYRLSGNGLKVAKYNTKLLDSRRNSLVQVKTICSYGILATPHTLFIAHAIARVLEQAGMEVRISTAPPAGGYLLDMYIVICPQMFESLPPGDKRIVFQLEQSVSSRWFTKRYLDILNHSLAVMDYSQVNLKFLESRGIAYPHTFYVPIGGIVDYSPYPEFTATGGEDESAAECEVLFYGDVNNERRQRLLKAIQANFRTRIIGNTFGAELHQAIRQAKVVVNLHYYEGALLETTRIYECLSLGVPVVSETSADIDEHGLLQGVVEFVGIDDEAGLVAAVRRVLSQLQPDFAAALHRSHEQFRLMLLRCLLALKHIDYEQFYGLTAGYRLDSDAFCLSLPETVARRSTFRESQPAGLQIFDGVRFAPGWVGCALSYKYLCQKTLAAGKSTLRVCEDDVALPPDFDARLGAVEAYLQERAGRWDIFSGMIAHLHPQAEVLAVEKRHGETFVTLDRMTSMVFNIYATRAIQRIGSWDWTNRDVHANTIDRYLERSTDLRVVTTLPFLVGHREEVNSSIWGFNNRQYSDMIVESQALLRKKVDEFLASSDAVAVA